VKLTGYTPHQLKWEVPLVWQILTQAAFNSSPEAKREAFEEALGA